MPIVDLEPAAHRLAGLVAGVPDTVLEGPTPCPDYRVGDLVEHIGGLALAFTDAATRTMGEAGGQGPSGDATRLAPDWRAQIPADLAGLARSWQRPDAWTGMTRVGGIDLPGETAGMFALDELVVHGWDLARATGQDYDVEASSLEPLMDLLVPFSEPGREAARTGLFGPVIPVAADAPLLDRVLGLTGRDPGWTPDRRPQSI